MNPSPSGTVAGKRCVFIVDDHPLVREGLTNLINRQSDLIVCGEAKDSAEAIAGIAKERPDVAIIDISLKNESGLELVKNVKSQFPLVGLIVLSMHDETLYAERALRAGARGYVMKREASKSVLTSIRRVLEGGVYLSEKIINRLVQGPGVWHQAPVTSLVERLGDRELEIFRLLGQGRTPAQIAADLKLSLKTVQTHYTRAKEKLGVSTLTELFCAAVRWEDSSHVK